MRLKVRRYLYLRSAKRVLEDRDGLLADSACLVAERRERALGIGGAAKQRSEKFPVRLELLDLEYENGSQPAPKVASFCELVSDELMHLVLCIQIELKHEALF